MKVFDYVSHAIERGYEPVVCSPEAYEEGLPLFENPRFSGIRPGNGVAFAHPAEILVGTDDLVFFSWPGHYKILEPRLGRGSRHEQVIHIVQNIRHANPNFTGGYALRLLTRPMARIMTNEVVLEAVRPYLNESSLTEVIDLGHDCEFFARERTGGFGPLIKVAYTTWKSDVGDRVASLMGDTGFEFGAIRDPVGWGELRALYHWADVFLATPLPEEGFYLPGLEAMAAGAVVISPDAGGNRAYCDFGENCLPADFDDVASYAAALKNLKKMSPGGINRLRRNGYGTANRHTLEREKERFGEFLELITSHLDRTGCPRKERGGQ